MAANPNVSFALDVTDIGRNIMRLEGTARQAPGQPPANEHPAYLANYTERMAAMFGIPESSLPSAALGVVGQRRRRRAAALGVVGQRRRRRAAALGVVGQRRRRRAAAL